MPFPAFVNDTGSGTPIIFIHAFPLNSDMWARQHSSLPSRVVSFDLPGFGRGGPAVSPASMESYADMLFGLMDGLSIDKAVLGGCSMGGYIAMQALRQQPSRFSGIILSNTRAGSDTEEAQSNRYDQAKKVLDGGKDEFAAAMLEKLVIQKTYAEKPEVVQVLRLMMNLATPGGIAAALKAMAKRPDSMETLKNTGLPACIITGKQDPIIPVSEAEEMHNAMKNSELHIIEDAGHLAPMERADAVNSILSAFIERIEQS